jgi:hypothetical protein
MSSSELTDPWEMHRALRDTLVSLTIAYLNAHSGRLAAPDQFRLGTDRIIALRDSVLYRFESLAYHVDLVRAREQQCLSEFRADMFRRDMVEVVRWASRDVKFLLDDIVFSTVSLFDYLGNAIGFLILKEPIANRKWRGIVKWADCESSHVLATAKTVCRLNEEWIRGVADYRNSLIHAASDTAGGRGQYQIEDGRASLELRLTAPQAFVAAIEHLRSTVPPEGMRVIEAALWIVGQTYDSVAEVVASVTTDLGLPSRAAT